MQRSKPPFRADHVGSILRSAPIKEARARREKGEISAAELRETEDGEIKKIIKKQEDLGLGLATDGEYRRSWWHFDFFWGLTGCEKVVLDHGIKFHGVETRPESIKITGKLDFPADHPMLEHFKFLKTHTNVTPKMCIPAPTVLHFRLPRDGVPKNIYPDIDGFFEDLGKAYNKAVKAFYDAGCRYLQFDDTAWSYLCSKEEMASARQRMTIVDRLPEVYQNVVNAALKGRHSDMTVTTHICRGNFRSTWVAEGGYEPVAERLFGGVNFDGYFLEYDTDRAGGFEPLRFLPKGPKTAVLGLVTSKSGTLESKDAIKRRIEEASRFAPLEQFCLSPQCGFASTEEGNVLAEEEQWAKLKMIVDLSKEVWG
ncbi:MAG TPA: 5-methyltetrahydropteroyltriglutamate--homocysteine S-methyltransferase [Xanthobacteraceae bacterium]|jgi:5-methyltetrahydropteroyltriglutamate--homocysteine methyltransferase|nr:5-methyltetrahydropteroyltriglutamate--homocysteine S-methyltransferase [Xanthobacteraceae bacterium]